MLQTETHTDDPFVMIRTIRDKIYEQSKHLTPDERIGRTHRESEAFYKRIGNLEDTPNPDFSACFGGWQDEVWKVKSGE